MKVYQKLASLISWRARAKDEWIDVCEDRIADLADRYLPSGSGFDSGTHVDLDNSTPEKIVLYTSFHHMSDLGYYTRWTDHTVKITPSLEHGFVIKVSNPDRAKPWDMDYFHETFDLCLSEEYSDPSAES